MSPYRIIVAGCGGMARTWVRYALERQDAEIVALVDLFEESARRMAEEFGLACPIYTDITQALQQTDANLVFDVTIPASRVQVVSAALGHGCHVMSEKPMGSTMEEARAMARLAEERGLQYAVMQNRRYLKDIRDFRSLLADGTIGRPGFVNADFFLGPHFGGFRDAMESPLVLDMAIHTFDQARFLTGAHALSVYCHEFNPPGSWYQGNAAAVCIFEMSDGSVFCYRGSWCAEGAPTSWEADWRITGERGTALWDGRSAPYCEVIEPAEEQPFLNACRRAEPRESWQGREHHFGCLDEMFLALAEGRPAETASSDNLHSMAMVFGALESAAKGRKIVLGQ
ncbi:oxidoreductase domain-containing protein [Paenibacillus mucilaginosus 3016]|uniref:Oxidoreductase domain-containing protein n=1 Tax=Paenibacillus mucilaginosus 3016 TaxID=1116391 RepID=H6NC56_9BACL|nr:Gfo/Idh/MocA family oxidoreductase [Paenibacillus mucilaginosus]AFC28249.1 oxidoreductase domain-containing protein [Paenibacillus mucilaginosus 3016]WFA17069.1 Gfo/Idh/MocA family oxidoreductase [Paenibacillus mucilaginosus]